ncbi:MAG TPA: rRNA maturation RNase YbeY [Acidimicrobiales bacterium]|nr:rRNA maturation RNase YbeY [Acidimicrobiales bacterium]
MTGTAVAIDVFAADEQSELAVDVERFATLARHVLGAQHLKEAVEVSLLFVDEPTIAELHERFLGEPGPTDVLAFPIDEEPEQGGRSPDEGGTGPGGGLPADESDMPVLLGDVVVCPTVAARNAAEHGVGFDDEVALLVVHGLLHLLGMDHVADVEAEEMERRERELLARFHRAGP